LAVDKVIAIITYIVAYFSEPPCGLYMKWMSRLLIRYTGVGTIFGRWSMKCLHDTKWSETQDETETKRYYVWRSSRDRDVKTETTSTQ